MQQPTPATTFPTANTAVKPPALYLALDQGGSNNRALIFDQQGQLRYHASRPVSSYSPAPFHVEQQPQPLLSGLRDCIRAVLSQLSSSERSQLCGWGLSCQRASLILVDKQQLQPLTPVISWQDTRSHNDRLWTPEQQPLLTELSGLQPSHHLGAAKIHWCLQRLDNVKQAAQNDRLLILPLAAYLTAELTHQPCVADTANSQRTLLWNCRQQDWDPQLLSLFKIQRQWLPSLRPCLADWGSLEIEGLRIPGLFVGGDQGCAHFGNGQPQACVLQVNLGTGAFLSLPLQSKTTPLAAVKTTVPTAPPGMQLSLASSNHQQQQWMIEGTINAAGAALQWLQQQEQKKGIRLNLEKLYRQPLQPDPGYFINATAGLGSPFWRTDIDSVFCNSNSPEQRYSAVIESILFLINYQLNHLQQNGFPTLSIELSGGLSQACGLAQQLADLCQSRVCINPQSEASGRGLAFLMAGQPEGWKNPTPALFLPKQQPALQQRYQAWLQELKKRIG